MGGHTASRTGRNIKKTRAPVNTIQQGLRSGVFRQLPEERKEYPVELKDVKLNPTEEKIFSLLKRVGDKTGTTVRVAGGWVRDKLLGMENNDIDISVDNMTGEEFAKHVAVEMGTDPAKIAVIRENPEQSKHLATATMKIEGLPIDMVNLRSETYADDSRVPEQKMGTAEEDASRRDLTINSMFYNVSTGQVEDFTGKGLSDLSQGVSRPPLEGTQTFMDDPLRVLRLIRFACRYGHKVPPETIKAMSDSAVKEAFAKKVAPDRIHKELDGALKTDPVKAVRLWIQTGMIDNLIPEVRAMDMDQKSKYHDKTVLEHTLALLDHVHKIDPHNVSLKWAALLHDIGKPPTAKPDEAGNLHFVGHERESAKMAEGILKRLKYPNALIHKVSRLVENHMFPFEEKWSELKFNRALRGMANDHEELEDLLKLREADIMGGGASMLKENMNDHRRLLDRLKKISVPDVLGMRPYVTGTELQQMFQKKPGKWIGVVNEQLMDLQLGGKIKNKEDALKYLKKINVDESGKISQKEPPVRNDVIVKMMGATPGPWMKEAMAVVESLHEQGKSKDEIIAHLQKMKVQDGKLIPASPE